jgi:hypothetical protein
MAVLMLMEVPGATLEQYDRASKAMGHDDERNAPEGLIQHLAGQDGDSLVVVDVWESEEALGRFFESQLGPALAQAGIPTDQRPRILPVHNALQGAGTEAGVVMLVEIEDLGTDKYDEMVSKMDAHVGDGSQHPVVTHTAASTENGGVLVADLWESPEAFGQFAETQIGPAGAAVGLGPIEPRFVAVHKRLRGRAAQPAAS